MKPRTPWQVRQHPNGEPFIQDADGYTVTQVAGTIRNDDRNNRYQVLNRDHAEAICTAVNAMWPAHGPL